MERIVRKVADNKDGDWGELSKSDKELNYAKHFALKNIIRDTEAFSFNTSIARIMEFVNALTKYDSEVAEKNDKFYRACILDLLRMLAPFAPHFTEELWEVCGKKTSVFKESYPVVDEKALVKDETEYAVQVNSKIKAKALIAEGMSDEEIQAYVCSLPEVAPALEGKTVRKCIIVKGRLINLIVG